MTQTLDTAGLTTYRAAQDTLENNGLAQDPAWTRELRKSALSTFLSLGFPTARRGNEAWKYTNVAPIASVPFQPPAPLQAEEPGPQELARFTFDETSWNRLVFLDGTLSERLSSTSLLTSGVTVQGLASALQSHGPLVQEHLARLADCEDQPFTALNTAFLHDGALVHVPKGVQVIQPIHLVFLSTGRGPDVATHPRVLVVAETGSQATVIESCAGLQDDRYFCNAVSEVVVEDNASVDHYRLQRHGAAAYHVGRTQVRLHRDARFSSVALDLGGALVRNDLTVVTDGEGASCKLSGAYLTSGTQHVDNQVIIDHAKGHTSSRELYKGVLSGSSRTVFHGSIIVREGSQKVDARQEDRNLLLSAEAEADVKPAFWIYADDVKCGHGAASGRLDDNALFYLRSRGLDEDSARRLLMRGFVKEVIDNIQCESLKLHVENLVDARLEQL